MYFYREYNTSFIMVFLLFFQYIFYYLILATYSVLLKCDHATFTHTLFVN